MCVVKFLNFTFFSDACSGKGFNWQKFQIPSIKSKHGWLLAGGLHPYNVCEAIATLKPDGVDVSSGICSINGIQKDPLRISSFMSKVNSLQFISQSRSLPLAKRMKACLISEFSSSSPLENVSQRAGPIVKMCGITSVRDAELVARAGASLIGFILWPNSKRFVSLSLAKEISKAARDHRAEPVGVFVDDDFGTMLKSSDAVDLEFLQLHGDGSRAEIPLLLRTKPFTYVLHADENGKLLNQISNEDSSLVD
ncbi:hypothetical protein KSP39_PZI005759 [Platanthera zijinensis]|uniref:phosphoribosylanthranilate isomerase n=1 Tax=Platanthera zijinensis TaxID=2320716 RepID=A0AAP0GBK7_9ASPA